MTGKRAIAVLAGSMLMLAVVSGFALAHGGFGGSGHGGRDLFLVARAAGLTHSQIASAFKNDPNLKADRGKLKDAHEAMMSCLVSNNDCSSQITSFANAVQAMTQERMTVLHNLFKTAPNLAQATAVYSQLQQLHAQQRQISQSVRASNGNEGSSDTDNSESGGGNP
jgi:hypothetical protein